MIVINDVMISGDKFKKCSIDTLIDIQDYINMRESKLRTVIQWENIKHCHVTEAYRTIWSLSEAYFKLAFETRPIGVEQPPLSLIKEIYSHLKSLK